MRDIKKYDLFEKSHRLALEIYRLTAHFPQHEQFGLVSQMRRAAYSIPMNLVEGAARESEREFSQFVNIAIGSCEELRYQLLFAKGLSYISQSDYLAFETGYEGIKQMLAQLYKKIKST